MSEPKAVAETVDEVVPGVWRWHVLDQRIDAESDAHAVSHPAGTELTDPLPPREAALKRLEPIVAICLTAACHQRSAWRSRKAYGVKVDAPEGCRAMDEEPDDPVSSIVGDTVVNDLHPGSRGHADAFALRLVRCGDGQAARLQ